MPMNTTYKGPDALPDVIAVFPLPGALLLPRGQMPLNIFEPRYLAMIEDTLRSSHRIIGMIQPDPAHPGADANKPNLFRIGCVGRVTQFAESGDGRYLIQLTGIARFGSGAHFDRRIALLRALTEFLKANNLKADWEGIENAPNEALVNALAMMSPYDVAEKQALLEAPDLKTRAEILVAVTEIELAKSKTSGETPLQ